jgi:hypothetical protein
MIDFESIAVHLFNNKEQRSYLVFLKRKGVNEWLPLRYKSTVKQLNKKLFIVLHHADCSVDKAEIAGNKWSTANIRPPQIILIKSFESMLFVFTKTQSFCIIEQYKNQSQKIIYYQQKNCFSEQPKEAIT